MCCSTVGPLESIQTSLTLRPQAEGLFSRSRKLWARRRTCSTETQAEQRAAGVRQLESEGTGQQAEAGMHSQQRQQRVCQQQLQAVTCKASQSQTRRCDLCPRSVYPGLAHLSISNHRPLTESTGKWEVRADSTACMASAIASCCCVHWGVHDPPVVVLHGLAPRTLWSSEGAARAADRPRPAYHPALPPLPWAPAECCCCCCACCACCAVLPAGPMSRCVMAAAWQMASTHWPASLDDSWWPGQSPWYWLQGWAGAGQVNASACDLQNA